MESLILTLLSHKCWDIKLAYCWADLLEDQMVALKYPKGYERSRDLGNGVREPNYIVLSKTNYGLPVARKHWADHRDEFMLQYFNKMKGGSRTKGDGPAQQVPYTCTKCTYDPNKGIE